MSHSIHTTMDPTYGSGCFNQSASFAVTAGQLSFFIDKLVLSLNNKQFPNGQVIFSQSQHLVKPGLSVHFHVQKKEKVIHLSFTHCNVCKNDEINFSLIPVYSQHIVNLVHLMQNEVIDVNWDRMEFVCWSESIFFLHSVVDASLEIINSGQTRYDRVVFCSSRFVLGIFQFDRKFQIAIASNEGSVYPVMSDGLEVGVPGSFVPSIVVDAKKTGLCVFDSFFAIRYKDENSDSKSVAVLFEHLLSQYLLWCFVDGSEPIVSSCCGVFERRTLFLNPKSVQKAKEIYNKIRPFLNQMSRYTFNTTENFGTLGSKIWQDHYEEIVETLQSRDSIFKQILGINSAVRDRKLPVDEVPIVQAVIDSIACSGLVCSEGYVRRNTLLTDPSSLAFRVQNTSLNSNKQKADLTSHIPYFNFATFRHSLPVNIRKNEKKEFLFFKAGSLSVPMTSLCYPDHFGNVKVVENLSDFLSKSGFSGSLFGLRVYFNSRFLLFVIDEDTYGLKSDREVSVTQKVSWLIRPDVSNSFFGKDYSYYYNSNAAAIMICSADPGVKFPFTNSNYDRKKSAFLVLDKQLNVIPFDSNTNSRGKEGGWEQYSSIDNFVTQNATGRFPLVIKTPEIVTLDNKLSENKNYKNDNELDLVELLWLAEKRIYYEREGDHVVFDLSIDPSKHGFRNYLNYEPKRSDREKSTASNNVVSVSISDSYEYPTQITAYLKGALKIQSGFPRAPQIYRSFYYNVVKELMEESLKGEKNVRSVVDALCLKKVKLYDGKNETIGNFARSLGQHERYTLGQLEKIQEETKKAKERRKADEKKVEQPKVVIPSTEKVEKKVEQPKVVIPSTEKVEKKVEQPKVVVPSTEKVEKKVEQPKVVVPSTEKVEKKVEQPKVVVPSTEKVEKKVEQPKVVVPSTERVEKVVEPKIEKPKVVPNTTTKVEKVVEPKVEQPKVVPNTTTKVVEPKVEQPKAPKTFWGRITSLWN